MKHSIVSINLPCLRAKQEAGAESVASITNGGNVKCVGLLQLQSFVCLTGVKGSTLTLLIVLSGFFQKKNTFNVKCAKWPLF